MINEKIAPSLIKKRIYAFTADLLFLYFFNKTTVLSFTSYLKSYFVFEKIIEADKITLYFDKISPVIFLSLFTGYFIISHFISNGLTIGKMIFGIKLVPDDKSEKSNLQFFHGLLIVFGYYINFMSFGLALIPLPIKSKKSFFDFISFCNIKDNKIIEEESNKNLYQLSPNRYDLKLNMRK